MAIQGKIQHVAIIMDGNGRWATDRKKPRFFGHIRGASKVSDIVDQSIKQGIRSLTLFAFSTENWKRPRAEISVLFKLLHKFLLKEFSRIQSNNIKFQVIGDTSSVPQKTKELIVKLQRETQENSSLNLTFAFSYGGKQEIVAAVNQFQKDSPGEYIKVQDIEDRLWTRDLGEVDLLIRTGGEQRISNFLLWQTAYSELFFSSTYWPDFSEDEFQNIIEQVETRERRFGGLISFRRNEIQMMKK